MSQGARRPGYGELAAVFLRISVLGFGGPNAHIALMLDEIVERRRWLSREHFLQLVAVTNLLPGPNSSEVAIHVGHTQRGWRGGLVTGLAFLAPTFLLVVLLSSLYFRFGTVPVVTEVFWGVKPAIVAVILGAGWRLGRTVVTDRWLLGMAVGGVAVSLWLARWEVAAMALGGVVGWLLYGRRPSGAEPDGGPSQGATPAAGDGTPRSERRTSMLVAMPGLAAVGAGGEIARLFWVTFWTGSVLFGGGYMLVALLQPFVVDRYGWLTTDQFLDGIALTQAVPGPIVTLVAFVGYAVAGVPGAAVATAGIYLPSFAAVFGVAPFLARWREVDWIRAALKGVNAVVTGAIVGVGLTLIRPAVPDVVAAALLIGSLVALLRFGTAAIWLILAGLVAGLLRHVIAL
jgi:chromate transporter